MCTFNIYIYFLNYITFHNLCLIRVCLCMANAYIEKKCIKLIQFNISRLMHTNFILFHSFSILFFFFGGTKAVNNPKRNPKPIKSFSFFFYFGYTLPITALSISRSFQHVMLMHRFSVAHSFFPSFFFVR